MNRGISISEKAINLNMSGVRQSNTAVSECQVKYLNGKKVENIHNCPPYNKNQVDFY